MGDDLFDDDPNAAEEAASELRTLAVERIAAAGPLDARASTAAPKSKRKPGESLLEAVRQAARTGDSGR